LGAADYGFPVDLRSVAADVKQDDVLVQRLRKDISRAYEPLALYARASSDRSKELALFVLNDKEAVSGTLLLSVDGIVLQRIAITVQKSSALRLNIDLEKAPLSNIKGKVLRFELLEAAQSSPCADYSVYLE
jgi:hypothetical protein